MKRVFMKKLFLFLILSFPFSILAQSSDYYVYNIVTTEETKKGVKVRIDNGKDVETLKKEDGKDLRFNTSAAVLMYLISQGWELYVDGSAMRGSVVNGIGAISSTSYWIIRKPCSKEEFEKTVEEGIKK